MGGHFIWFRVGGGCVRVGSAERVYAVYLFVSRARRVGLSARIYLGYTSNNSDNGYRVSSELFSCKSAASKPIGT